MSKSNPFREPYGRQIFEKLLCYKNTKDGGAYLGPFPIEGGALATDGHILVTVQCGENQYTDETEFVEKHAKPLLEKVPASDDPLTISVGALREKVPQYSFCICLTRQIPTEIDPHDEEWHWKLEKGCCVGLVVPNPPSSNAVRFGGAAINCGYLAVLLALANLNDDEIVRVSPANTVEGEPMRIDCAEWTAIVMPLGVKYIADEQGVTVKSYLESLPVIL